MQDYTSRDSIVEATRWRAKRSAHGGIGAAGWISPYDGNQDAEFLSRAGETAIVNAPDVGLPNFEIGLSWDNVVVEQAKGFWNKFLKKTVQKAGIDMDLGCLYQLADGSRGAVQAFGETNGAFDEPPYLLLDGDERTGDKDGRDEMIHLNGAHWEKIDKILVYTYIYGGAERFSDVRPQVQLLVPNEKPIVVTLNARRDELDLCAVAMIENIRGGIRLTTHLEYYPGHAEMDRAFGFGLEWEQGKKD
jgi:tellurite resistance protein TerA